MTVLESLTEQRQRVLDCEHQLRLARQQQLRLIRAARRDRYKNAEIGKALGLSRERVRAILELADAEA
jgi:DNA-directed RNA polymerase sigma subunit (sigma70/sigma32)